MTMPGQKVSKWVFEICIFLDLLKNLYCVYPPENYNNLCIFFQSFQEGMHKKVQSWHIFFKDQNVRIENRKGIAESKHKTLKYNQSWYNFSKMLENAHLNFRKTYFQLTYKKFKIHFHKRNLHTFFTKFMKNQVFFPSKL